jgi:hypothetical protein
MGWRNPTLGSPAATERSFISAAIGLASVVGLVSGLQFVGVEGMAGLQRRVPDLGHFVSRALLYSAIGSALASLVVLRMPEVRDAMEDLRVSASEVLGAAWATLAVAVLGLLLVWRGNPRFARLEWILSPPGWLALGAFVALASHADRWIAPAHPLRSPAPVRPDWRLFKRLGTFLVWEQPEPWAGAVVVRWKEQRREILRGILTRVSPFTIGASLLQFWLIGRIPGGGGPLPLTREVVITAGLLGLPLLMMLPLAIAPRMRHVEIANSGLRIGTGGGGYGLPWWTFDAFAFATASGVELLKLRRRSIRHPDVWAIALQKNRIPRETLIRALTDWGLVEEPLGEPVWPRPYSETERAQLEAYPSLPRAGFP